MAILAGAATLRILIVDDNQDAAESLSLLLRLSGHETRAAFTAEEALATYGALQPSLVLVDLAMPGMDGLQLAGRLRQMASHTTSRIVALTGYADEEHRRLAEPHFDGYLVKPLKFQALEKLLASIPRAGSGCDDPAAKSHQCNDDG